MKTKPFDPIGVALEEDIGSGDVTTGSFVPANLHALGRIVAREKAIVAGTETAVGVFHRIDPAARTEVLQPDGSQVNAGDSIIEIRALARSILTGERVALNFLQRLSGIATLTRKFVEAAATDHVKILDTRKTTPGLRALEKAAVRAGGGTNHRFGLYDMALVKDNHLNSQTGLAPFAEAVRKLRKEWPDLRIEVEADNLDQVRTFLQIDDVDVILLDNMNPAQIREAVALGRARRARRRQRIKFEASGGITLQNVRQIAATGVDYISIGALTHSARAIDFSLELTPASS